jgi:hypothetical protein
MSQEPEPPNSMRISDASGKIVAADIDHSGEPRIMLDLSIGLTRDNAETAAFDVTDPEDRARLLHLRTFINEALVRGARELESRLRR